MPSDQKAILQKINADLSGLLDQNSSEAEAGLRTRCQLCLR